MKTLIDDAATLVRNLTERLASTPDDHVLPVRRLVQLDGHSCAAHCALMVLEHFGKGRSLPRTLRMLRTDQNGTETSALRELFASRGLRVRVTRSRTFGVLQRAIARDAPVIVAVDRDHVALVFGVGPGRVWLADPAVTRQLGVRCSWAKFRSRWGGWAMAVSRPSPGGS